MKQNDNKLVLFFTVVFLSQFSISVSAWTSLTSRLSKPKCFKTNPLTTSTKSMEDSPLPPQKQKLQHHQGQRRQYLRLLASLSGGEKFQWTPTKVVQAIVVFVMAGIAEIGGGWLIWKAVREHKPWWWALAGSIVLVLYGFIPTLQPTDSFGRIYAVYGGFFIALSYAWGWKFDGMKPDTGDLVGGSLALLAVLVILFWPRQQ